MRTWTVAILFVLCQQVRCPSLAAFFIYTKDYRSTFRRWQITHISTTCTYYAGMHFGHFTTYFSDDRSNFASKRG